MNRLRLKWAQVILFWWSWTWRSLLYSLIIALMHDLIIGAPQLEGEVSEAFIAEFTSYYLTNLFLSFLASFVALKTALEIHMPLLTNTSPEDEPVLDRKKDRDSDGDDHLVG